MEKSNFKLCNINNPILENQTQLLGHVQLLHYFSSLMQQIWKF